MFVNSFTQVQPLGSYRTSLFHPFINPPGGLVLVLPLMLPKFGMACLMMLDLPPLSTPSERGWKRSSSPKPTHPNIQLAMVFSVMQTWLWTRFMISWLYYWLCALESVFMTKIKPYKSLIGFEPIYFHIRSCHYVLACLFVHSITHMLYLSNILINGLNSQCPLMFLKHTHLQYKIFGLKS